MLSVLITKQTNKNITKEHKEILGGDGYLDCGNGITGVYLCPNPSKCIH